MRPQQQNRRMRGRGSNNNNNSNNSSNRKGPNPLTRSYESNGPDVKIRGTAQQVAEKYATLARDSYSSGDRVMSENYLQHAEHYYRIIAAAQAQQQTFQQQRDPQDDSQQRDMQDDFDGDGEGSERDLRPGEPAQPQYQANGFGPQPVIEGTPAEVAYGAVASGAPSAAEQQPAGNVQPREGEEGAPRRPRRPRRPLRGKPEQAAEGADTGEAAAQGDMPATPKTPEAAE